MAAEAVVTFAAEEILNKVLPLAAQEFSLAWGFNAELRKLRKSFASIERFLVDVADQPQGRSKSIEEWVKNLKDVAQDAEDVLDEFQYEVDRRKVEIQNHIKKKVLNFMKDRVLPNVNAYIAPELLIIERKIAKNYGGIPFVIKRKVKSS